jgi:hypothetical protein
MNLKTYFSFVLAVSHEQLMNRLARYNEYAMGWVMGRSGFESRRSRDFLFVFVSILALGLIQWVSRAFAIGV